MNPISQAVLQGYNAIQILQYLSGLSPKLKKHINDAKKIGHTPEKILDFLSNKMESESPSTYKTSNKAEAARRNEDAEKVKKALGVGIGVAALGAYGIAKGISTTPSNATSTGAIRPSAIYPAQPQPRQIGTQTRRGLPAPGIPGGTQSIIPKPPTQQVPTTIPSGPTIQMGTNAPSQSATPNVPNVAEKAVQSATNLNLMRHIQDLSKRIDDPKAIAGVLYNQFPKEMKKFQDDVGKPMEEAIGDIIGKSSTKPETQNIASQPLREPEPEIEEKIEPIKLEKKTKIVTPESDIGEINQISGKNALIETENGKKNEKIDKLEAVTPEVNDVLENYKKLIESIPEEHKSAVVNFIGYDPDRRKLSVRFHGGDQYNYEDLDEEDVTKIAEAFHLAKTTGGNMYGAWSPNDPSRGAGLYKLIQELQKKYGGKGKEYSAKFKTLYDYFALPKRLLEEEKNRLRDEKRAKKKPKKA